MHGHVGERRGAWKSSELLWCGDMTTESIGVLQPPGSSQHSERQSHRTASAFLRTLACNY